MRITLNGDEVDIAQEGLNIAALLELQKVESPDMVSVQVNGEIVERSEFLTHTLAAGDEVEFLFFMGGGC